MTLDSIPIDAYLWTLGAIITAIMGFRGFTGYQKEPNPINQMFMLAGFGSSLALCFYGIPLFFTDNVRLLEWLYFIGDTVFVLVTSAHVYFLWLLVLRKIMPLWPVALPVAALAASALYVSIPTVDAAFELHDGNFNAGQISPYFGALGLIYIVIGVYFFKLVSSMARTLLKFRLAGLALLYCGVGIALVSDGVILRSREDNMIVLLNIIVVIVLFAAGFFLLGRRRGSDDG